MLETAPAQKREDLIEKHRCGVGQVPFEGQARTSHNSKVPELGGIMHALVSEGLGTFIIVED